MVECLRVPLVEVRVSLQRRDLPVDSYTRAIDTMILMEAYPFPSFPPPRLSALQSCVCRSLLRARAMGGLHRFICGVPSSSDGTCVRPRAESHRRRTGGPGFCRWSVDIRGGAGMPGFFFGFLLAVRLAVTLHEW